MNPRTTLAALLLLLCGSAGRPYAFSDTAAASRHLIRHDHQINCLSCFCGDEGVMRARHACSPDRDLVLCPPSPTAPSRNCYRCACHKRIPISPSPPVFPVGRDGDDKGDEKMDMDDKKDIGKKKGMNDKKDIDNNKDTNGDKDDVEKDHKEAGHRESAAEKVAAKKHDSEKDADHDEGDHKDDDDKDDGDMDRENSHKNMKGSSGGNKNRRKASKPAGTMFSPSSSPEEEALPTATADATDDASATVTPAPGEGRECAEFSRGGGGGNTLFDVNLGATSGTFRVRWRMDRVPDKIDIFYEGAKLYSTRVPVSGNGVAYVTFAGQASVITVWVTSPSAATGWFMTFGCPV